MRSLLMWSLKSLLILRLAEALRVYVEGLADAAGRGIDGGGVEEEAGAFAIPALDVRRISH